MIDKRLRLCCVLVAFLLGAPAAHAELEAGEEAPALHATAFVNTQPLTLAALRGRVVLLEFFSTGCKHCKRHVPQLSEWHARYAGRGLTVLGVTRDSIPKVKAFARRQRVRYAIASAGLDAQRAYLVQRYPEACLISAFGEVLWSGPAARLPETEITRALARARPQPVYALSHGWIATGVAQGRYAATRRRLAQRLRCRPAFDAGCATIHAAYAWFDWYARERRARATALQVLGRLYAAWRALDEVRRYFDGAPEADAARQAIERLLQGAVGRREVAAGRALTAAVAQARTLVSAQAARVYDGVALRHRGTKAAERAQRKASRLRKKKR